MQNFEIIVSRISFLYLNKVNDVIDAYLTVCINFVYFSFLPEHNTSLPDFLQWLSGARRLPPGGFSVAPRINFCASDRLPVVSTCALMLTLPRHLNQEDFRDMMSLAMTAVDFAVL